MRHWVKGKALLVAVLAVVAGTAQADDLSHPTAPLPHDDVDYRVDSGNQGNPSDQVEMVWSHVVNLPSYVSMRLHFSLVSLESGSVVRVVSAFDNDDQVFDGELFSEWFNTTAYFNGDTLTIELWAAPGTTNNRIVLSHVEAAKSPHPIDDGMGLGGSGQCGICGSDDRAPSAVDWSGRIMNIGCTGSVYNTDSCVVSAGHCRTSGVIQFRVPNSNSNCSTNNPPALDQFPISGGQSRNSGVGADWWVTTTGTNGAGQRPYDRYGVFMPIATAPANTGQACTINGYGVDQTCTRSQTQQLSTGSITFRSSSHYEYNADVRGGNSGSGLIVNNAIVGIVTHCSTGCPNYGTRHDNADFAAARDAVCPDSGGVECSNVKRLKSRCRDNGAIKGTVVLLDNSNDGDTVTVSIDNTLDLVITVVDNKAKFNVCCYTGTHNVSLKDPSNCASTNVTCP